MLKEDLKQIAIKDLLRDGKISVRTSNCCFNARFETILDILEYYESGESFFNIRNAGKKTCIELEDLYKEYIHLIESPINTDIISEDEKIIQEQAKVEYLVRTDCIKAIDDKLIDSKDIFSILSLNKKTFLSQRFEDLIENYSIRTKNRLKTMSLESFVINYLFAADIVILGIDGLGQKSLEEVVDLKNKIKELLVNLINLPESYISRLNLARQKGDIILNTFVDEFYNTNNHLPMLWILEQQLTESKNRSIEILIDSLPILKNHKIKTLDEIAEKYSLTRERVRQIRHNTLRKTFDFEITNEPLQYKKNDDLLKYAELLSNKDDWKYLLELLPKTEAINQESFEIQEILKKEQCNFSELFVLQIIAYIFRDKYSFVDKSNVLNKSKNNTFLIDKEFTDIFDFEKFIIDFSNHIDENEEEYELNVDEFLSNSSCWLSLIDLNKFNDIIKIVKDILLYEFHLYSNLDGLITIPATKEKRPLNIVYEILLKNGNPMHIDDIFVEFKKILPEHKYIEAAQLRSWLQLHKEISFISRKSVYTLKEWKHIKSGTIRDTIVEFLSKKDYPQSANDITEYVLQYFPKTNIASIRTTMFNDTQKRFSYFNDNLFGLVRKTYPTNFKEAEQSDGQRKAFEQRLYDLEKFLSKNDHFPFSTSESEEEMSLYRWWRTQSKETELSEHQKNNIERIKGQYADYENDKRVYDWFRNFNNLRLFILENKRLPLPKEHELFLHNWFRKARYDFLNDRLSERQRIKYAEFFKEIKYVKK